MMGCLLGGGHSGKNSPIVVNVEGQVPSPLSIRLHFVKASSQNRSFVRDDVGSSTGVEKLSHIVLLRSDVVWYGYNIPQSQEFVNE